ncbi:MAG: DUF4868 domain-containing protein [Oceanicaulis sp.]
MSLESLKRYQFAASNPSLWVFKARTIDGERSNVGGWVEITNDVRAVLKEAAVNSLVDITETRGYSILGQTNEGSAMTLPADETVALEYLDAILERTADNKVTQVKHLKNASFYAALFEHNGANVVGFRKVSSAWATRKSKHITRAVFSDEQLTVDGRDSFEIDDYFDFILFDGRLYIFNKNRFESVLNYRQAHEAYFQRLIDDGDFIDALTDVEPISTYVGGNKIHLRRAVAIYEKGFFRDPAFLHNLRELCDELKLSIDFDDDGKIVPSPESCPDIFAALLDHRLVSRLSARIYDVSDTSEVVAGQA